MKEWDTDNLAGWSVSAKNYRIPYHNYNASGYKHNVAAKACVAYNVRYGGDFYSSHLRSQNAITRECPSGYSLVTQVCAHSGHTPYGGYNSPSGYVPVVYQPAGYNLPKSAGTCDQISYRPAINCSTAGNLRTFCTRGAKRVLSVSLISVPHVNLCRNIYGQFSLRRSASNCSAAYAPSSPVHVGCQSAVADAFFQTGGSLVLKPKSADVALSTVVIAFRFAGGGQRRVARDSSMGTVWARTGKSLQMKLGGSGTI